MICIKGDNLVIDSKIWEKDGLIFIKEISRGANGIVYLAEDPFLGRKVVFKIWTKLKPNDLRDKFKQGKEEAKKTWEADKFY